MRVAGSCLCWAQHCARVWFVRFPCLSVRRGFNAAKLHSSASLNGIDRTRKCHLTIFRTKTPPPPLFSCSLCCLPIWIPLTPSIYRVNSYSRLQPPQPMFVMQVYGFVNTAVHWALSQEKAVRVIEAQDCGGNLWLNKGWWGKIGWKIWREEFLFLFFFLREEGKMKPCVENKKE